MPAELFKSAIVSPKEPSVLNSNSIKRAGSVPSRIASMSAAFSMNDLRQSEMHICNGALTIKNLFWVASASEKYQKYILKYC